MEAVSVVSILASRVEERRSARSPISADFHSLALLR